MILISACNIIYLILLHLFVQLTESSPDPLDEVTINVNIGAAGPDTHTGAILEQGVKCGVKKEGTQFKSGIVGGNQTEVNEYPWMAQLVYNTYNFFCGASVIADKWILTAAHCVVDMEFDGIEVIIGEHDMLIATETNITKHVKPNLMIIHPKYPNPDDGQGHAYDIALLRIPPIDLKTYTPICLPHQVAHYTGKHAWTYGWGMTESEWSTVLLDAKVPIVSDAEAYAKFAAGGPYGPRNLTDTELELMIFAGEEGKSTCHGDSGGPLSYSNPDNNGRHEQIGIVSWGWNCGEKWPGVFAEVSALIPWIVNEIQLAP